MPHTEYVLTFLLGGLHVGLRAPDVVEATRVVRTVPLPAAPAIVEGVINYRGDVVPVLDIRTRFGLPAAPVDPDQHLVVARAGHRTVAFRVERAEDVIEVPADRFGPGSADLADLPHVGGIARLDDGVLVIYDLERFLSDKESDALDRAVSAGDVSGP